MLATTLEDATGAIDPNLQTLALLEHFGPKNRVYLDACPVNLLEAQPLDRELWIAKDKG